MLTVIIFTPSVIDNDNLFFSVIAATIATLPIGLAIFVTWWHGQILLEGYLGYEYTVYIQEIIVLWVVFTSLGYWQYFKALPWLKNKHAKNT